MTITELIEMDVEKLEAMSNEELENFFRPMFEVTRPTISFHAPATDSRKKASPASTPKIAAASLTQDKLDFLRGIGMGNYIK